MSFWKSLTKTNSVPRVGIWKLLMAAISSIRTILSIWERWRKMIKFYWCIQVFRLMRSPCWTRATLMCKSETIATRRLLKNQFAPYVWTWSSCQELFVRPVKVAFVKHVTIVWVMTRSVLAVEPRWINIKSQNSKNILFEISSSIVTKPSAKTKIWKCLMTTILSIWKTTESSKK